MRNLTMRGDGSTLVIEIDLAAEGSPSASGKTLVIASTHGNVDVPGATGIKVGLNVYGYTDYTVG